MKFVLGLATNAPGEEDTLFSKDVRELLCLWLSEVHLLSCNLDVVMDVVYCILDHHMSYQVAFSYVGSTDSGSIIEWIFDLSEK
jgi:hypothetical protein